MSTFHRDFQMRVGGVEREGGVVITVIVFESDFDS